ncbi:hypothetical protein [Breoghania sp.]|uniref:hypothetical protein n=1 Tax=Breoghania sp. TaxID=2065378 RepID=UPI00260430C5|nr:hypothetical protein [Breoghania sp.]MDJ0929762.1 hypothetical protein [Breoghania sp.]
MSLRIGETAVGDSGPTSASRGTQIAVRLVRKVALRPCGWYSNLRPYGQLGGEPEEYVCGSGGLHRISERCNRPDIGFAALAEGGPVSVDMEIEPIETHLDGFSCHTLFTACAARASVVIDRWTGRVTCTGIDVLPPAESRSCPQPSKDR